MHLFIINQYYVGLVEYGWLWLLKAKLGSSGEQCVCAYLL